MKASIVEMEGLLRGKCVPAKMLVNESLAEYLVRQFDALHERADKAERERDELRAEIARRDAVAGEPVGYIDPASMRKYRGVMAGGSWSSTPCGGEYNQTLPIYTAAQPALLPPDITFESKGFISLTSEDFAYNRALEDARKLGVQQQKVVELDNVFSINVAGVPVRVILLKDVSVSMDAAGVKWEVKK